MNFDKVNSMFLPSDEEQKISGLPAAIAVNEFRRVVETALQGQTKLIIAADETQSGVNFEQREAKYKIGVLEGIVRDAIYMASNHEQATSTSDCN